MRPPPSSATIRGVTAPKGGLGHLIGASGAVEAIATVLSIRERVVPPTVNLDNQDPANGLDVVAR